MSRTPTNATFSNFSAEIERIMHGPEVDDIYRILDAGRDELLAAVDAPVRLPAKIPRKRVQLRVRLRDE